MKTGLCLLKSLSPADLVDKIQGVSHKDFIIIVLHITTLFLYYVVTAASFLFVSVITELGFLRLDIWSSKEVGCRVSSLCPCPTVAGSLVGACPTCCPWAGKAERASVVQRG